MQAIGRRLYHLANYPGRAILCHNPHRMAQKRSTNKKKLTFKRRITITLDPDAQALANDSAERTKWVSQRHFVNACIRRAALPFASPELAGQIAINPFEQIAFRKRSKK